MMKEEDDAMRSMMKASVAQLLLRRAMKGDQKMKLTRKQVLKNLEDIVRFGGLTMSSEFVESVRIAMEAYEQEPCEDCISRQAVMELPRYTTVIGEIVYLDGIKALPPVQPKPKTGHWIEHDCKELREMGYYKCSECDHGYQRYERGVRESEVPYINGQKYELHRIDNFCPNCGAKMEVEG